MEVEAQTPQSVVNDHRRGGLLRRGGSGSSSRRLAQLLLGALRALPGPATPSPLSCVAWWQGKKRKRARSARALILPVGKLWTNC